MYEISIKENNPINIHIHYDYAFIWSYEFKYNNISKWLLTLSDTKYIKENFNNSLVKEELENRKKIKLDLFIYLSKNEKIKKLLDMHAINIIFTY